MGPEKKFETKVKKYLKSKGAYIVKHHGGYYSARGVPDLLVCYRGLFIALELKSEKGKLSELQRYNIREISKAGGIATVLYPKDFEEFKGFIEYLSDYKRNDTLNYTRGDEVDCE